MGGLSFYGKLRVLKCKLRVRKREVCGDIQVKKKEILNRIDEIDALELDEPLDSS